MFSDAELERYSRHILLSEVGEAGQAALKAARVLIVGAGGLGSPVATYLAAAGIGTIGLVDFDVVELSNLQRQILFSQDDLGLSKVDAAVRRLSSCNDDIAIVAHNERFTNENALSLVSQYDLVVDCSDNFPTRYAINDACLSAARPFVYGSIYRFEGQVSVFCESGGPCYRCLFPEENATVANCAELGVLGVLAGVIGSLQTTEALKILLGIGENLAGRLLLYDALSLDFTMVKLAAAAGCTCAALRDNTRRLESNGESSLGKCEPISSCTPASSINPAQLKERLKANEDLHLLDVRTVQENKAMRFRDSQHIELALLEERLAEVSSDNTIVVYCRSGIRSARAARLLRSKGYSSVLNLSGGILSWYKEFQDYLLESDLVI